MGAARKLIGVISDTHGLVRPQAIEAMAGADLILHAGDIGNQEVLDALREIAPVVAVRGNNDKGEWGQSLPDWEVVEIGAVSIYMLHDLKEIDITPTADIFQAGPRRFTLPVSVAHLHILDDNVDAEIIELSVQ